MEISALKKKLIHKISVADEQALMLIEQILDNMEKNEEDFFDTLPIEIQDLLSQSLKQIENGEVYTHNEVREMTQKKYGLRK